MDMDTRLQALMALDRRDAKEHVSLKARKAKGKAQLEEHGISLPGQKNNRDEAR